MALEDFSSEFQKVYKHYFRKGKESKRPEKLSVLFEAAGEALFDPGRNKSDIKSELIRESVAALMYAKDAETEGLRIARRLDSDPSYVEDPEEGEYSLNHAVAAMDEAENEANRALTLMSTLFNRPHAHRPDIGTQAELISDLANVWEAIYQAQSAIDAYETERKLIKTRHRRA